MTADRQVTLYFYNLYLDKKSKVTTCADKKLQVTIDKVALRVYIIEKFY